MRRPGGPLRLQAFKRNFITSIYAWVTLQCPGLLRISFLPGHESNTVRIVSGSNAHARHGSSLEQMDSSVTWGHHYSVQKAHGPADDGAIMESNTDAGPVTLMPRMLITALLWWALGLRMISSAMNSP